MQTYTKISRGALIASQSVTAGNFADSTAIDLRQAISYAVMATITNGGTGPTTAARMVVQVSDDGSTWFDLQSFDADLGNNVVTQLPYLFDLPWRWGRIRLGGQTGQSVTVAAWSTEVQNPP
jgi:hypothetical protein